jgi:hypothetical protein
VAIATAPNDWKNDWRDKANRFSHRFEDGFSGMMVRCVRGEIPVFDRIISEARQWHGQLCYDLAVLTSIAEALLFVVKSGRGLPHSKTLAR